MLPTEGLLRHSEFSFFLNPGLGVQLYLLPRVLPAASLQDIWVFSQEEDPAAFSAGSEVLREHLQSDYEQEDDLALSAT